MRRTWKALAMGVLGALPLAATAQTPFDATQTLPQADKPTIGGTPTIDYIRLSGDRPGVPLRFGGVVSGSERVELDGRVLTRNVDYRLDYGSGILYVATPVKPGQALTVSYRYDKSKETAAPNSFGGAGSFRFELVPSALKMVVGLGVAERVGSQVLNSNLFGWNNSFKLGGGNLQGLYLFGDRQLQQAQSAYEFAAAGPKQDTGKSHFTLQNFSTKVNGGEISASYQDISKNFAGFGAAQESGIAAAQVQQLQKEKGLTRTSLNMTNVGVGDLKLSNSFKTVNDEGAGITWRNMGVGFGGFGFTWGSQAVDKNFKRFNDLAEGDRGQLAKEAGMSRNWYGMSYAGKGFKATLDESKVLDPNDHGVTQRKFALDSSMLKLNASWQDVDSAFSRVGSLPDAERNRLTREIGTERSAFDLTSNALKLGGEPIKISQSTLGNDKGEFKAEDVALGGKTWKLDYSSRGASKNFSNWGAMQDAERMEHINAIARMYQPGGFGIGGQEIGKFYGSSGVERNLTRLALSPIKGLTSSFDLLSIESAAGSAEVQTVNMSAKGFALAFRGQSMSDKFDTLASLMDFERARLGTIVGLDKRDLSATFQLPKGGKLALSTMDAESPVGDASRQSLSLQSGKLELTANQRNVDSGFTGIGQLVDPERDLLGSLRGFSERDVRGSWQLLPNLKLEALSFDAFNDVLDQSRNQQRVGLNFSPAKGTDVGMTSYRAKNDDLTGLLFANALDQLSISRSLGKLGSIKYFKESNVFDGTLAANPDSETERFTYETKLNAKTSYKTEQTRTNFDDGGIQNVSEHTVSTELSKRTGISVSNIEIDRKGEDNDQRKSIYGFWYDFGNGLKLMYGMNRQETNGKGTEVTNMSLTPGSIGNVSIGQSGYVETQADDVNTRSQGNVQLQTNKPFKLGFFTDLKLNASTDTLADRNKWQKQNRDFSLTGKVGSNSFLYGYKSQIHTNGYHAIDRSFAFVTDQDPKRSIVASLQYKLRTLPWDEQIMIRNYSLTLRPFKDVELSNQMLTNPTVDRPDQLLGSVVQASRMNRWKLDFKGKGDVRFGGQWDEIMDKARPRSRTGGVNVTLFANNPSPLKLFYGIEQADDAQGNRKNASRYYLQFDQKPGPNQLFSVFVGNVNYDWAVTNGKKGDNWTVRLDWQFRY